MQAKPRVAHNADLVSINIPRLTDVDQLSITGNKGLASVSFEALERANRLRIADNGFLTTLDGAFPALERVELLVIGNRYSTPRDDDDDRPTPKPTPAPTTGASLSTIGPGAFPSLISAGSIEVRTTGGAQCATRTTTARRTPTTSAATRTGASSHHSADVALSLTPRAHSFSSSSSSPPPSSPPHIW